MTLVEIISKVLKYKKDRNLCLHSSAYGPVKLISCRPSEIVVEDEFGKEFKFDLYGRIHPKGSCLLFPETKESWEKYSSRIVDEYYDSLLRIGDVCLVKREDQDDWCLAIYDGKLDGKYRAKVGIDSELWKYCISYSENPSYLGRAMFPDFLIPDEE